MKIISQLQRLVIIILFINLPYKIEAHFRNTHYGWFKFLVEGRKFHVVTHQQTYEDAQLICQKYGLVLARIYSTSQLQGIAKNIKKNRGFRFPNTFWVGARDHEGRFLWMADNIELKRNYSLWNKGEPNNADDLERCVQIRVDTDTGLNDFSCDIRQKFLCMELYDGQISMKVNNIETSRNKVVRIEKGKTLDIRCDLLNNKLPVKMTLTLNDEFKMNTVRKALIFHIRVTTCSHSGIYGCNADFLDRIPIVTASTSISIDIASCANASEIDNSSYKVDKGRPVCSGPNTELSEGICFIYFEGKATFKKAEEKCKQKDAVLAAFKSLSQMQNIFKGWRDRQSVWVGANNLQGSAIFRWIAHKKILRPDSPMLSKEPTSKQGPDSCLVRNTNLFLSQSDCNTMYPYMCMSLYSEVLTVNVNDEPTERNDKVFILKNSTMTIECLAKTTNDSIILSIRFKDHVIMIVSNQSRLVYDKDNAQCEDAGRYSCKVDFIESGISVEYFIFIDMDCPATVILSINQMVDTPSHHIMTRVGSDLYFNCTVNYAKEDFYLEILKNDKVLTKQYDITTVTFNLSVTGCNDSDVYTCQYHQLHPDMTTKSSPLFIGVHTCPTHILSFGITQNVMMYDDSDDDDSEVDGISGADEFRYLRPEVNVKLVCNAETYSRPTTLLIKSEYGNVLNSQENTSVIDLYSSHMTCKDKGKLVCQIMDHLRNETDSKTSHIWVQRCEPTLCRHQNHFKRLHPHLSHNVTAAFCFMMDRTLHRINEIQLFHDGRLLETNSTSKHVINIKADRTNPYQYTLDVKLVNVQVEDIGKYVILLIFNDRTVLTFFITVQKSGQSSTQDFSSPLMSYGLPCLIFLLLVLASVAIYNIVKKTVRALKKTSNKCDVGQVMSDGFKYTTIREE